MKLRGGERGVEGSLVVTQHEDEKCGGDNAAHTRAALRAAGSVPVLLQLSFWCHLLSVHVGFII